MAEPKDPSFKAVTFKTSRLCHSNLNAPIKFKLYTNKDSKPLGEVTISVSELTDKRELSIVDIETQKEVCKLVIEEIKVNENPDFIQFVPKGWEISCVIAIDYTASNKHHTDPESLHFLGEFNQYEQAIKANGNILQHYDTDKKFPVFGFGGKPRFLNPTEVNHCFPITGVETNPEVETIDGVLALYRKTLPVILFYL